MEVTAGTGLGDCFGSGTPLWGVVHNNDVEVKPMMCPETTQGKVDSIEVVVASRTDGEKILGTHNHSYSEINMNARKFFQLLGVFVAGFLCSYSMSKGRGGNAKGKVDPGIKEIRFHVKEAERGQYIFVEGMWRKVVEETTSPLDKFVPPTLEPGDIIHINKDGTVLITDHIEATKRTGGCPSSKWPERN